MLTVKCYFLKQMAHLSVVLERMSCSLSAMNPVCMPLKPALIFLLTL